MKLRKHPLIRCLSLLAKSKGSSIALISIVASAFSAIIVAWPVAVRVSRLETNDHERKDAIATFQQGATSLQEKLSTYMSLVEARREIKDDFQISITVDMIRQLNSANEVSKYLSQSDKALAENYKSALLDFRKDFGPDPIEQEPRYSADLEKVVKAEIELRQRL